MYNNFDGTFFDEDYFERGRETKKSWYENFRWLPQRSFREALAYIDYLNLDDKSYVLEFGTAKGFLIRALRELEIRAEGCDISEYALSFAPKGCWNCSSDKSWEDRVDSGYTEIIVKDVLEHLRKDQFPEVLNRFSKVCRKLMCVVPMGDNGVYRIPEYHYDASHIIAENEDWWRTLFLNNKWHTIKHCEHVLGLKDNWQSIKNGNHVFLLEYKC